MNDNIEETVYDYETPRQDKPETHVLTHTRLNTYLVLIFSVLNKAQIYKMPFRDSPHHEIELPISFNSSNWFKPAEYTED